MMCTPPSESSPPGPAPRASIRFEIRAAPGDPVEGRRLSRSPGAPGRGHAAALDGRTHKFVGLGTFPDGPIVGYLARSTSALYALHGAMVLFMSFDVARYARLIRFMAVAALVHGAVILGIDLAEGMPAPWRYGEGPAFAATGVAVLWLQRQRSRCA